MIPLELFQNFSWKSKYPSTKKSDRQTSFNFPASEGPFGVWKKPSEIECSLSQSNSSAFGKLVIQWFSLQCLMHVDFIIMVFSKIELALSKSKDFWTRPQSSGPGRSGVVRNAGPFYFSGHTCYKDLLTYWTRTPLDSISDFSLRKLLSHLLTY